MTKKIFLLGILFFVFLSMNIFGLMYGDVNHDGNVTIVDALMTAQFSVGLSVPNFDQIAADVDAVNGVTIVDALFIGQYFVGLITEFPADKVQPTPTPVSGSENIINGDFANGTANWTGGFYSPGAGNMSVSNGELHVIITNEGTATWNIQINQGSISLISGTNYIFSFAARGASARTIEANVGMSSDPYTSYFASGSLNISTTMTTYSFAFTAPASDAAARVEFNCGLAAVDVYIDNVSLIGGPAPTSGPTPVPEIINFPDYNLEAAIRADINKPTGSIYNSDVNTLSSLTLSLMDIKDLTGLEYFNALISLTINYNDSLLGITPLANLNNLKNLNLGANYLSDLTSIRNLYNLTKLVIAVNRISDLSPLANLINLTNFQGQCNEITDITPLANLINVTSLTLFENDITDISPLANLTKLTYLDLSDNQISNLAPLAGLTQLTDLNLCNNPISNITALGNLTNLQRLAINVRLLEDITPLANCTNLSGLNLDNNSISDITPLKSLIHLKDVSLIGNPLNSSAQAIIDSLRAKGVRVLY